MLAQQYERSRANVNRAYLHTLFHCLLRHPGKTRGRDADLWDLSCDIAVESMLDALDYRCLQAEKVSVRRQNIYRELRDELPVLTAEAVYRHFRRTRLNSYDCATLTRVFATDEHTLWYKEDDDQQERRWNPAIHHRLQEKIVRIIEVLQNGLPGCIKIIAESGVERIRRKPEPRRQRGHFQRHPPNADSL